MVEHFRELRVYRNAFRAAREIYALSKEWPKEERYALTDQIRRSSRSVAANIAEAWRKRRHERHFVHKLTDADAEAAETQCWLDFAMDCRYIDSKTYERLDQAYEEIIGGLVKMMTNTDQWCGPSQLTREPGVSYDAPQPPFPQPPIPNV
jgi:four helix bundle protein